MKIVIYSMYLTVLRVEMNSGILVTRGWSWEGEFGTQDNESIYAVILGGLILRLRIQHKDSRLKCCPAIYIDALTTQQSKWTCCTLAEIVSQWVCDSDHYGCIWNIQYKVRAST